MFLTMVTSQWDPKYWVLLTELMLWCPHGFSIWSCFFSKLFTLQALVHPWMLSFPILDLLLIHCNLFCCLDTISIPRTLPSWAQGVCLICSSPYLFSPVSTMPYAHLMLTWFPQIMNDGIKLINSIPAFPAGSTRISQSLWKNSRQSLNTGPWSQGPLKGFLYLWEFIDWHLQLKYSVCTQAKENNRTGNTNC